MPFPTVAFAVFFVAAFTANWLLRPHHLVWRATMIVFSLYFCGWVDPWFVLVVVGSAAVNGALAAAAHRAMRHGSPTTESRRLVRVAVGADLAMFGLFAYHGFLLDSVIDALGAVGLDRSAPVLGLLVPVGISFFTLHAISYVVDVGRGDVEPVPFVDLLLYLAFFPHLIAGPVVRVDELVPQFHERPDPRHIPGTDAFVLIGVGLVKFVVIAGFLGRELVDPAFADPAASGGLELLLATYAFAVQVYAAFSGATDIAVGCGLLLGIHYPLAFDAPYRAMSVREFWERWNVTLSRWLRDYLYIPLGGSRGAPTTTYRNLVVTMAVGGLWYGAGWNFLVWGGLQGMFLVGERAASAWFAERRDAPLLPEPVSAALRWLLTFNLICLAWVFFRAGSVGTGLEIVGRILTLAGGNAGLVNLAALAVVVAVLVSQFLTDRHTLAARARFSGLAPAAQAVILALVLTVIGAFGPDGDAPFRYLPF